MHLVENMAFVGETPWHGLGNPVPANLPVDEWPEAAGMAFEYKSTTVRYPTPNGPAKYQGKKVLFRSDTHAPMSIVSDRYKVVQPKEIIEFFRDVSEAGHMRIVTAGVLDEGAKIWALAETQHKIDIGKDRLGTYVLLATACDGSMQTVAQWTSVRVVCNNTLQFALQDGRQVIKVSHRTTFDATAVQKELGIDILEDSVQQLASNVEAMANERMSQSASRELITAVVTQTDFGHVTRDEPKASELRTIDQWMSFIHDQPGAHLDTSRGTLWGTLNAITYGIDHHGKARTTNNRFKSGQFGKGAQLKQHALDQALKIAQAA